MTVRHRLAALSPLFAYLCEKNAVMCGVGRDCTAMAALKHDDAGPVVARRCGGQAKKTFAQEG
jgi:hypothetical protein